MFEGVHDYKKFGNHCFTVIGTVIGQCSQIKKNVSFLPISDVSMSWDLFCFLQPHTNHISLRQHNHPAGRTQIPQRLITYEYASVIQRWPRSTFITLPLLYLLILPSLSFVLSLCLSPLTLCLTSYLLSFLFSLCPSVSLCPSPLSLHLTLYRHQHRTSSLPFTLCIYHSLSLFLLLSVFLSSAFLHLTSGHLQWAAAELGL